MSILQEYEEINKIMGNARTKAIGEYIKYYEKHNISILYSDIVYKEQEYKKFDDWFIDSINPFKILKHKDDLYSVTLDQESYWYDWTLESKNPINKYGDGHCYNDAFFDYLDINNKELNKNAKYDSENGMFCVYCKDVKDAEEIAYELSRLYKNEEKMIDLIKITKLNHQYNFDVKI